jgi:hypothetical protein
MEQRIEQVHAGAAIPDTESGERKNPPQHAGDTSARWRAIAGMAISVALACLIVMLEFTGESNRHASRIHRRVEALTARLSRLNGQIASERARVSAANREFQGEQALHAVLRAPDAAMLPLAPGRIRTGPAAKLGTAIAGVQGAPAATLVLSAQERRGVLIVTGLRSPAADRKFAIWCARPHEVPVRAAEFQPAPDGSALVAFTLPPGGVSSATVIAEESAVSAAADSPAARHWPRGDVVLRSALSAGDAAARGGVPGEQKR